MIFLWISRLGKTAPVKVSYNILIILWQDTNNLVNKPSQNISNYVQLSGSGIDFLPRDICILVIRKQNMYFCQYCIFYSKWKSHIDRHEAAVHEKRKFKCPKCEKSFPQKAMVRQHDRQVHVQDHPFTCDECQYVSYSPYLYAKHFKKHVESVKVYKCERCPEFSTVYKRNYTRHINQIHSGDQQLCELLVEKKWKKIVQTYCNQWHTVTYLIKKWCMSTNTKPKIGKYLQKCSVL